MGAQGGISVPDAAILAKSGALDSISGSFNRPQILWFIEARPRDGHRLPDAGYRRSNGKNGSQAVAFTSRSPGSISVPVLPDFSLKRKWAHESETLGFFLSIHPLEMAESFLRSSWGKNKPGAIVPASDMAAFVGKKVRMMGWPITRKEVLTREGEEMEFFTFEDKTAIFETVFFPKSFRRFCQDLDMSHAYLLHGVVESEFDVVSLTVDYAYRMPLDDVMHF
jgi:error-prone DNA polymerase